MTALIMEAVRTSEALVYFNETALRYIPEGSNIQRETCSGCSYIKVLEKNIST
jgi:hypothetical protein